MTNEPTYAATPVEALRWAVVSQRALAYNLGYLDLPLPELGLEFLPELTWQMLSELHEAEYELLNDFIIRRMMAGETLTPEWTTGRDEDDEG